MASEVSLIRDEVPGVRLVVGVDHVDVRSTGITSNGVVFKITAWLLGRSLITSLWQIQKVTNADFAQEHLPQSTAIMAVIVAVAGVPREIDSSTPHSLLVGVPFVEAFLAFVNHAGFVVPRSMPEQKRLRLLLQILPDTSSFNLENLPEPKVLNHFNSDNRVVWKCLLEVFFDFGPKFRVIELI
jgi:hypothetical protein